MGALGDGRKQWVSTSPGAQAGDDGLVGGRRLVDVQHERQAGLLGHQQRHVERGDAGRAAGDPADADLDADDQVLVGEGHFDRVAGGHEADVVAFAHHDAMAEGEDAGK